MGTEDQKQSKKAGPLRVKEALRAKGIDSELLEFSESTKTAQEAASAIGTSVGQIAKSLIFLAGERPILAIASGKNRVDEKKLKNIIGKKIRRANADQVKEATGFAIGGVPPVGHDRDLDVFIDQDLLEYDQIFAAAGSPHCVFPLSPKELCAITGGKVMDLKREEKKE